MAITSGPEQLNSRFPDSDTVTSIQGGCRTHSTIGLLLAGSILLACNAPLLSAYPSVQLAADRKAILVIPSDRTTPSQLSLQDLPTESTLAPGLFYLAQRFDLVRVSPDGRYAAFSAAGHHNLIGLLDLATMAVREIDLLTEGDAVAFHWAADGRTVAYDYVPASGYGRVKGYDIESGEGLVVPRTERNAALDVTFECWGPGPHEITLRVTDRLTDERRTETVRLVPHR